MKRPKPTGFALVELIVVVLIVGILVLISVPRYMKSVESSRADDAAATVQLIAAANRAWAVNHANPAPQYTNGSITNACTPPAACCFGDAGCSASVTNSCNLIACKILANQNWSGKYYSFRAVGNAVDTCGFGAANTIACAVRNGTGSPIAPYTGWGYTAATADGRVTARGGAPRPPP